jgi:hypothetical protein
MRDAISDKLSVASSQWPVAGWAQRALDSIATSHRGSPQITQIDTDSIAPSLLPADHADERRFHRKYREVEPLRAQRPSQSRCSRCHESDFRPARWVEGIPVAYSAVPAISAVQGLDLRGLSVDTSARSLTADAARTRTRTLTQPRTLLRTFPQPPQVLRRVTTFR